MTTSCSRRQRRIWDPITFKTISISISFSTSSPSPSSLNSPLNKIKSLRISKPIQLSHLSHSLPRNSRPNLSSRNSRLHQHSLRRLSLHLRRPTHQTHRLCLLVCTTQFTTQAKIPRTCTTALSSNRCLFTSPNQVRFLTRPLRFMFQEKCLTPTITIMTCLLHLPLSTKSDRSFRLPSFTTS